MASVLTALTEPLCHGVAAMADRPREDIPRDLIAGSGQLGARHPVYSLAVFGPER